jgi:RNA polymerase sigma-70 factor, ECF subfamily
MEPSDVKTATAEVVELAQHRLSRADMVNGLCRGEASAAAAFHRRYGSRISRWVWRLLGGDPEHDDVVHQVFVNILSSIGKLRDPDALDSWVDSVTIRTVRKEIRARRYRRFIVARADAAEFAVDPSHPARQTHVRRFYQLLAQLKPDDRIVLVLRHLEGCTLDEVARAGGYSLATAKRRLKRATRAFRKLAIQDPILISLLEPR